MSPKVTKRPPGPKDHAASTRTDARSASHKKRNEMAPSVATAFEMVGSSISKFKKDVGDTTQRLAKSARVFAHTVRSETGRPDKNIVQAIEDGFADAAQAFAPKPDFTILADEAEEYLDTIRHLAKSDPKLKPAALEMAAQYQGILGAGIASAVWDYQHDPDSRPVAQRQAMDFADAFYREAPTAESLDGVFATYAAVDRDVAKLRRAVARNTETIRTHVSKTAREAAAPLLDAADRSLPMGDIQFQKPVPAGPEAIFLQSADHSHHFARAENAILEPLLTATESRITTLVHSTHAQSKFYREAHLGMAQIHMGDPQTGVRHLESARQIFRDKGDAKPPATELATQIEVLHRIATNAPDDAQLAKDRLSEADSMIDLLGHDKGNRDKATLFRIDNLLHTLPHRIQEHDENLKHNPDNIETYHRAVEREHQKIIDYCAKVKSKDPAIVALAHGNGMIQASVQFEKRLDAAMALRLRGETEDARLAHLDAENKFTQIRGDLEHTASPSFTHEAMGRMHWANATYTFKTGAVEESLRDLRTLSTTYGASGAAQILKDSSGEVWVHHYGIVDNHGNFSPDIGKPSEIAKWKKIADAALDDKASAMKAMMAGAGVAVVGVALLAPPVAPVAAGVEVMGGGALLTLGQAGMLGAGVGLITERGYQVLSAQREISAAYTTGIANVTTEELADRGKALAGEVAVCFLAGGAARYVRMGVTTLGAGLRAPLLRGLISESGIVAEGIAFHEFAGAIHGETDRSVLGYFRSILTLRMLAAGSELNLGSLLFPGEKWADAVMRHGFNTAVANIPLQAFESAIARDLSGFGQGYFDGLFGLYAITLGGKIPETIMRAPQILAQAKAMHQERSARKLITRAETLANTISTLQSNRDYARTPTEKTDLTQKLITAMRAHAAAYQKLVSMGLYPEEAAADYAEGVGAFTQFAEMAIQHQKSATPSKAKVTAQQIATGTRKLAKSTVRYGKLAVVAPALLMTGAIGGMGGGGQRRVAHSIPEHFLHIIGVGTGWSREGLNIAEQTRKNPQRAAGAILNHLVNLISLAHYVDTPEPEMQSMARAAMTEMYTLLETLLLLPPEVRPSGQSDGESHDVAFVRALNSRRGNQRFTEDALKYIDRQFETHYSEMLVEGGPRAAAHLSDLDAMWGEPVDLSDVNKFWPLLGTKPEEMPKATRMVRTIVESRAQELGVAAKDVCVTIAGAGRNASEVFIWLRAGAKVHVVEPEEGAIASLERSLTRMGMSEEEGGRLTSSNEKMGKNTLETSDVVVWNFPRNAFGLAAKDLSRSLKPGGLLIVQTDFPELYVDPFTTRDASKEFEPIFSRPLSRQNFLIPSGHLSLVSMADLAIFRRAMPESGTLSKSDAREPSRKWVEEAAPRPTLEAKAIVDREVTRYEQEIGREYKVVSKNIDFEGKDPQSLIDRARRKLADGHFTPEAYAQVVRAYRGQLQHVIGKVRRAIYHTRSATSVAKIFAAATSGIVLSPADAHMVLDTITSAMRSRARAAAYVKMAHGKFDIQLMDAAENKTIMSGPKIDAARNQIIATLLSEGCGEVIPTIAGRLALSEADGILVVRPDQEADYQNIRSAYSHNRNITETAPDGFSAVAPSLGVAIVVVRPNHMSGHALLQRELQRQWSSQSPLADQEILAHLKSGTPLSQVLATPVAKRAGAAERVHLLYEAQDQLIARGYSSEAARQGLLDALTVVSFNDWLTEISAIRDVLMREKEDGIVPMMAHARDRRPYLRQWVENSVFAVVNGQKNLDAFLETQDRQFAEARQRLHGRLDPDHLMDMRRKWCVGETQVEQMVDVLILLANEAHTHLDVLIHRAKTNPSLSLNAQIQKAEEVCALRDGLLARAQAHVTPTQFHELQTDIDGRLRFKHAYFQNKVAEKSLQQQEAPDLVSKGVQESLPFDRDPVAPERKGMTMLAGAALMADVSSGLHQVLANVADTVFAHPYATTAAIVATIAGVRLYTDHLTQMGRVKGAIKSMGIQKLIEDRSPDPKDPIVSLNAFFRGELGREPTLAEVRRFEASTLEFKERREVYYLHQTAGGSPIYQIYTKEFLNALATRITISANEFRAKHGHDPVIVEIAAGDGRLSRSLRARGVAITATDVFDRGWGIKHADDVVPEGWSSATERADIILGSWLPRDDIKKRQVLDAPIVQHIRTHPDKTYIQIESYVTNTSYFKYFVFGAQELKTLAVDEPREFFELLTSRLGEETTHLRIYRGIPKEGARGISETYEETVLLFSAHLMPEAREMTRTLLDTGKAMIARGETVRLPHTEVEFDDYGKFAARVQQMLGLDNFEWAKIVPKSPLIENTGYDRDGRLPSLAGTIPGLTPELEAAFNNGAFVMELTDGKYVGRFWPDPELGHQPVDPKVGAPLAKVYNEWRAKASFVSLSPEESQKALEKVKSDLAPYGITFSANHTPPATQYQLISELLALCPTALLKSGVIKKIYIGRDQAWLYNDEAGLFMDGELTLFKAPVNLTRAGMAFMFLHEAGHGVEKMLTSEQRTQLESAWDVIVKSKTGAIIPESPQATAMGGATERGRSKIDIFTEFIAETNAGYALAGGHLRHEIKKIQDPKARAAYETVYAFFKQLHEGREFGAIETIPVRSEPVAPQLPDLPPPLAPADPVVNHMAIFPDVRGLYHAALKAYQRATQPTEKFVIGISGVGRPVTIKLPIAKSFDAADQAVARDVQRPILKKWVRDTIFTKDLENQPILEGTAISPDQEKVYQETRKILGQLENAMNAVARKYFDELRQPKSAELTEGQYPPPVNVAERAALYQKWCSETDAFLQIAAITEEMAKEAEHRVEDDGDKATPLTKSIASVRRYIADRIADTITSAPWSEVDARLTADRNAYIIMAQAAIDVTDPGYIVPPDPSNLQRMTPQAAEAYAVELRAHFASPTTTEAMSSLIAFDKLVRAQKLSRRAIEAAAHDVADQLVNGSAPYGSKDHPLYLADRLLGLSVPTISMSPDELVSHWTHETTEAFTRHMMDAVPTHTTPPADGEYGFNDARSHESKTKVTRVPKKLLESGGAGGGVFMIAAMLPAWMEGGRELYKRAVQGFFDGGQKALSKKPESTLQAPATVARNGSEHYVVIPTSTRDTPPAKMPGSDGVEYRWKRGALEIRDLRESVAGTTRITIDDGESSHVLPKGKWCVLHYGNKLTIGVKTFTVARNFSVHAPTETTLAADVRKNAPQLERMISSGMSPYDCLVLLLKFANQSVQVGPDGHVYDNLEEPIPDNAVYRVNRSTSKFRKDAEALVGIIRRQFDRGEPVSGNMSHTKFPSRAEVEAFFAENRLSPESHAAAKRSYPFSDRVRDMMAQSPDQTPSSLLLGLIFENENTPDAMKADTLRTMAELRDYVVSEELTWGDALYNPETGTIMFRDDLDRFIDQKVGTPGYSQALVRVHDVQSRYTPEVAGDLWGSLESLIGDAPKRTPVDAFGFYLKDSATSKAFYKTTSYEVRLGIIRDAVMTRIRSGEVVRDMSGNQLKSAADFDRLVEQKLEQSLSIRKTQKIDVPVKPTPPPMPAVSDFLPKPLAHVSHDVRVHLRPFVDAFFNRQGASLKEATQELQMLEEGDSPTVSGPRKDRKFRTTGYTRYRNADTGATRVMDPTGANEQWRDNFIAGVQHLMPDGVSPEFPVPRDGNYFIPGIQGWYWGGAMMSEGDTPGKSPWDGRIFFAVDKGNDAASDIPKASILYAELSKMATAFKSRGTKVMFKIISGRSDRSDAAILYFKAGDEAAVYERMCQLSKLGVMRDRLPLFVAPLTDADGTMLPGIGFAQHPSGQSFGARRARILNPIMDELDREAATGVRRGRVEVEGILAAALAAGGVDPEIPAFDAGGREKFPHIFHHMRFSREGEAPTIQGVDPDLRDLLDLLDSTTRNLPRGPSSK